jgi:hypothetical protein
MYVFKSLFISKYLESVGLFPMVYPVAQLFQLSFMQKTWNIFKMECQECPFTS